MINIENKFMTIGVKENISLDIQLFMWNEIEERINAGNQVDYLQVFNISVIDEVRGIVKIEHIQEVPEYKKTLIIKSKGVKSNLKVFVTFESEYATMMLASEYWFKGVNDMSYELKEEVSFNIDKELWLGNLRFDFYDSKETLCNKFFPSDLIYELDRQEVISLKKIQEEVNLIQFNMIKNYNNLVSLCGGQGYSFEKVLYIDMEEANYAIKLIPTTDSYNYLYIYRKGDK